MQPRPISLCLAAALTALSSLANDADMTIACQSIRVSPATAVDLTEFSYAIAYSTDVDAEGNIVSFNDEWFASNGTIGYMTAMQLDSLDLEFGYLGILEVDIPMSGDENLNFITDFFEVDHAVSASTTGTITIEGTTRDVEATWSRAAGQTTGNVNISFSSPSHQIAGLSFDSTFEIYQYQGKLTYTPASEIGGIVAATVDLTRVGGDTKFTGPMPMKVLDPATLDRQTTDWKGPNDEIYSVLGSMDIDGVPLPLDRLVLSRPWYGGSFFFLDGVPSTDFQDEYDLWDVFIVDSNDTDKDGIPDLSDPGTVIPTEPPTLSIAPNG
ncbi:MAG TPA: hypothetical protein PLX89_21585, partial [Verrucomicrobiota bacterium]|nr:hypothetical protein [Verrucomicrobiota bacterium]